MSKGRRKRSSKREIDRPIIGAMDASGTGRALRVLHVIHDFLPRHRAGSEIYAAQLCNELASRHHVTIVCADYDPARAHGQLTWRLHDDVPVVEITNNWVCANFEDTYRSPLMSARLEQVLDMVQPQVVHVHNLLNLSFDLPAAARARGIPVVATLHDYTLVCASGGQRIHRAESHVCRTIDTVALRPVLRRVAVLHAGRRRAGCRGGRRLGPAAARGDSGSRRIAGTLQRGGQDDGGCAAVSGERRGHDRAPGAGSPCVRGGHPVRGAVAFHRGRVHRARSRSIQGPRVWTTASARRLAPLARRRGAPLRIGFVGTLAWHKGAHVLLDAVRRLANDTYELQIHGDVKVFPDYVADLRRRAEGMPVRFMGRFDEAQAMAVYGGFDVLVVPSLWLENSPLVIHEAFQAGVPVVGSRIGGTVDLVTDGVNGRLYDPAVACRTRRDTVVARRQPCAAGGVGLRPAADQDHRRRGARVGADLRRGDR